jgi:phage terminase large subunit
MILAWNPISSSSWLYDFSVTNPPANSIFIHSTYKDNPFLSKEYIATLEELYIRNPAKARVFCDGEWGSDPEGLVFSNWRVEEFDTQSLAQHLEHRVGADFGFIDPSTIIASLYDRENKKIYVYDEFYKTGCQLDVMYDAMVEMQITKAKIYMDSAEPRSIDFFRKKGINAVPCIKGADSVQARIAFL